MILMVYNRRVCKEFLIPNLHDADYALLLYREIFQLKKDIEVRMENSMIGWEIVSGDAYVVKEQKQYRERYLLKGGDIIELETAEQERLQLIVVDCALSFPVTEKYDIRMMKEISIGKKEGNLICYQFMDLISASHLTLVRHSDGWYLSDTSSNGVFCENIRVQGQRKLSFGDHIELFGLHLFYLGDILAVGTLYGNLKVKEDILKVYQIPEIGKGAEENRQKKYNNEQYFHRSPRKLPVIYKETVEIEAPPNPKIPKQKPLYLTIGPAFTMAIPMMLGCGFAIFGSRLSGRTSGAFMYTGLITAVASAMIGVLWAFLNMNYSKKEYTEEENHRFNAYSNYLIRMTDSLRKMYQQNTAAMLEMYPSADQCLSYNNVSSELWNRNRNHADFLYVRLGLGEQPFQAEIEIPKEKFTLINDTLLDKPKMIKEEFRTLHQVPVGISLLDKSLIGLVGGRDKRGAVELMHMLVAGIASVHCYTDVKLVFIYREYDRRRCQDWECMRWFPHVWSEEKKIRYMAADNLETADVFFELSNIIRSRMQEGDESGNKKRRPKPHYVLFVSDPSLLEGEMIAKYIYEPKPEYGLTTFLMVENANQLPNACEEVIENDMYFKGMYNLMDTEHEKYSFLPDRVDVKKLEAFGKTLANIQVKETESSSEIPDSIDFFQMYGVTTLEELQVLERWRKNRNYNSMRALIGKKAGNIDCFLDIHEKFHGPHGLIAGTTGSGKSETLQTYMLSLAMNFSPEDISFFIIDFKGAGMANLFEKLPHLAGQISNLSGNQVHRAMISIKSENMRRQKIFSEYGVNNINLYTKLYKNHEAEVPIPHLLIIIDEFAELKREEPEFMRELISVAQVGRSLGVHLILATQKPSGTVDDNIWSNSKFRLCLRVQDRQDSNDMLHKPDAAFITQAGRGYLQVGNDELYELFQSGYSGAVYQEGVSRQGDIATLLTRTGKVVMTGSKGKPNKSKQVSSNQNVKQKTQLEAVIEYLGKLALENHYKETMQLWLPVLKEKIYLEELPEGEQSGYQDGQWNLISEKWSLEVAVGLYDDPEQQAQRTVYVNFSENGHLAVCGAAVSGKSTFLQTLVYSLISKYSPDQVQMYLIDFSSHMLAAFEEAPHIGGVIFDSQEEKLEKFIYMIVKIMEERKKLFRGGNYSQYVRAYGVKIPALFLIIDNLSSFREKTKNGYDEILLRLAREGVGYGIFLVVTAAGFGMSEIPARIGDNIRTVVALEQADRYKYMDVLRMSRIPILPETGVRGRGLAVIDGRVLEFQTALSISASDDFERGQVLEEYVQEMKRAWKGKCAVKIPEIPEKPTLNQMQENEEYQSAMETRELLPVGYRMEDASIYSIDLSDTYCYAISGKSGVGKTNMLKVLLYAAKQKQGQICVVETKMAELKNQAEECGAEYVSDSSELFAYLNRLLPEFSRRNKKKRTLLEQGLDESEIFDVMKEETPIFIFLADMAEFFRLVYKPGNGVGQMSGFVENIMEKGSLHHIYFFGSVRSEDQSILPSYRAYSLFISYKKGIHIGGNLNMQKIFSFQNISFTQQTKTMKKGRGYVPDNEEESIGREVVIPLAKIKK